MIYITGDTHGNIDFDKLVYFALAHPKLTKKDFVMIAGDFGGVWGEETEKTLDRYEKLPFTVLFVDGNHENYDRLKTYQTSEWCGGKVQFIRPGIIHLMRGQVFTIEGKTVFTMGGAESTDKASRIPHVSWWEEELPTAADFGEANKNLAKYHYEVDYVVTHSCDAYCLYVLPTEADKKQQREENGALCFIEEKVRYRHWYFGHYHCDANINSQKTLLYQKIIPLGKGIEEDG